VEPATSEKRIVTVFRTSCRSSSGTSAPQDMQKRASGGQLEPQDAQRTTSAYGVVRPQARRSRSSSCRSPELSSQIFEPIERGEVAREQKRARPVNPDTHAPPERDLPCSGDGRLLGHGLRARRRPAHGGLVPSPGGGVARVHAPRLTQSCATWTPIPTRLVAPTRASFLFIEDEGSGPSAWVRGLLSWVTKVGLRDFRGPAVGEAKPARAAAGNRSVTEVTVNGRDVSRGG
jgi:hypothetical protein